MPPIVHRAGYSDFYTSELIVLLFDKRQAEPVTGNEKPFITINIETLMGIPAPWTSCTFVSLRVKLGVVRQHKRSYQQVFAVQLEDFLAKTLRRRGLGEKWIPRLHPVAVDPDLDYIASQQEAMEGHSKMSVDVLDEL